MKKKINYKNGRDNKFLPMIGIFLVCSLFFITVGFSALSTSLSVNGSASFTPVGLIRVMSIKQDELINATGYNASIMPDSIKTTFDLNGADSSATYTVIIKNLGQVDYQLKSINEKLFSNNQIEYVLNGFHIGDVIKAKEEVTFTITFKYKNGITGSLDSRLNSELQFEFEEYVDLNGDSVFYDELVFDGNNYINTGIKLFSEENINKNFEIYFDIDEISPPPYNAQAAIINSMREVSPYPGFVFRHRNNETEVEFNSPSISNKIYSLSNTNSVYIKRYNDVYYIQINGENLVNLGKSKNSTTFDVPVTIGASLDGSGNPWRFFKGKLSNVYVKVTEDNYAVKYDVNGGTGTMPDQIIRRDELTALNSNAFTRDEYVFKCWNTKADGTGTNYNDEEEVLNITNKDETITLYAIWTQDLHYAIHYNANGGTGSMSSQEMEYGETQNIKANEFTKGDSIFIGWNTKADRTGTYYKEGQAVKNLTQTNGDIIELYAIWSYKLYTYDGEYEFTGNNYIDTGVYLFADSTVNRDFEISFEIISRNKFNGQPTMLSCMDETGSPWPGIVYRVKNQTLDQLAVNSNNSLKKEKDYSSSGISKVYIKRTNNVIFISFDGENYEQIQDMSGIMKTFNVPVTFGSSLNGSGNPMRYFVGTLKDMNVILYD